MTSNLTPCTLCWNQTFRSNHQLDSSQLRNPLTSFQSTPMLSSLRPSNSTLSKFNRVSPKNCPDARNWRTRAFESSLPDTTNEKRQSKLNSRKPWEKMLPNKVSSRFSKSWRALKPELSERGSERLKKLWKCKSRKKMSSKCDTQTWKLRRSRWRRS